MNFTVRDEWNLECPSCHSDERLQVALTTMADLTPEGTDPWGDHEWDDKSFMRCAGCGHCGCVADFEIPENTDAVPALTPNTGECL